MDTAPCSTPTASPRSPSYTCATPEQLERFQDEVFEFLFARNALLAKREAAAQARAKP